MNNPIEKGGYAIIDLMGVTGALAGIYAQAKICLEAKKPILIKNGDFVGFASSIRVNPNVATQIELRYWDGTTMTVAHINAADTVFLTYEESGVGVVNGVTGLSAEIESGATEAVVKLNDTEPGEIIATPAPSANGYMLNIVVHVTDGELSTNITFMNFGIHYYNITKLESTNVPGYTLEKRYSEPATVKWYVVKN